jgi:hypothetical protein
VYASQLVFRNARRAPVRTLMTVLTVGVMLSAFSFPAWLRVGDQGRRELLAPDTFPQARWLPRVSGSTLDCPNCMKCPEVPGPAGGPAARRPLPWRRQQGSAARPCRSHSGSSLQAINATRGVVSIANEEARTARTSLPSVKLGPLLVEKPRLALYPAEADRDCQLQRPSYPACAVTEQPAGAPSRSAYCPEQ